MSATIPVAPYQFFQLTVWGERDYLSLLSVLPLGALPEGARARAVGDQRLRSLASRAIQRRTLDSGGNYSASGRPIER